MMLEISWTADLKFRYGQPAKPKEWAGVGTCVGPANEPPMTFLEGFWEEKLWKALENGKSSRMLYVPLTVGSRDLCRIEWQHVAF